MHWQCFVNFFPLEHPIKLFISLIKCRSFLMQFMCDLNVSILFQGCCKYLRNKVESCLWLLGTDGKAALGSCDKPDHMSYVPSSANMNPARLWTEQQCSASRGPVLSLLSGVMFELPGAPQLANACLITDPLSRAKSSVKKDHGTCVHSNCKHTSTKREGQSMRRGLSSSDQCLCLKRRHV